MGRKMGTTCLLLSLALICHSQSAIVASGTSASTKKGSVSYSIGQIDFINETNSSGTLSAGVQQAYIQVRQETSSNITKEVKITLYPNPTHDRCHLTLDDPNISVRYSLQDVTGKVFMQGELQGDQWISLASIPNGVYLLNILQNRKENQKENKKESVTFKIIKE